MIDNEYVSNAIEYIINNSNNEITVDDVAKHCNFSKYHFSRLFKLTTGESIYAFIKRIKMEQSAFRLKVDQDKSITDIGNKYGYSSSNYSCAFKQHHTVSPLEFRRNIHANSIVNPLFSWAEFRTETYEECNAKITIEDLNDYHVIYERHIGNYNNLDDTWNAFLNKYKKYITAETLMIDRTFDDPTITDTDECLYDICMSVDKGCPLKNTYIIDGGKFAVYHYKGSIEHIHSAYQSIFCIWLSKSNYSIDERYGFNIYHKIDRPSMYMELDICIPIK